MLKLIVCLAVMSAALAFNGFDISRFSGAVSVATFQCMKNAGFNFAIIQAWGGGIQLNPNWVQNWRNAKAAGIKFVDIYIFSCLNCAGSNPANIMNTVKGTIPSGFDGQVWLDVEPCNGCWGSASANVAYVNALAVAGKAVGFNQGVYSSYYSWQSVMGGAQTNTPLLQSLPLWYAHYDGQANFNDAFYYKFGGWTKPNLKQYLGDVGRCGLNVDLNWYPDA